MTPRRLFPPPVGWIPFIVGLIAVIVLSLWGIAPQFKTQTVGVVSGAGGGAAGPAATGSAGTTTTTTTGGGGGGHQGGGVNPAGLHCAAGQNGGSTAPGVSANAINIRATTVTSGVGSGFLGEAQDGIQAAVNEVNAAGGICGRLVSFSPLNDGWDPVSGNSDIQNFINSGNVFALVGQPDSEGLDAAHANNTVDTGGIPVVGTDGLLKSQYFDPLIFPVAASTVTNMHIIAKYAYDHGARHFGIVYDTTYKFGLEGANAFDQEVKRLTGSDISGYSSGNQGCDSGAFCGVPSNTESGSSSEGYSSQISNFDSACKPCDAVVLLLEPQPAETWMQGEASCGCSWYSTLYGGEPLFDDSFATACGGACAHMIVWTGYHPAVTPFDGEPGVAQYVRSLQAVCPSCDAHNEFTEGAYLGTKLFLWACAQVGPDLTRSALTKVLTSQAFQSQLSTVLRYAGLPHQANVSMAAFQDNAPPGGSFNGWSYLNTGFLADPAPGSDLGS